MYFKVVILLSFLSACLVQLAYGQQAPDIDTDLVQTVGQLPETLYRIIPTLADNISKGLSLQEILSPSNQQRLIKDLSRLLGPFTAGKVVPLVANLLNPKLARESLKKVLRCVFIIGSNTTVPGRQ